MRFDFAPEPEPGRPMKAFLVIIMLAIAFSPLAWSAWVLFLND